MVIRAPPHGVRDCMNTPGSVLTDVSSRTSFPRSRSFAVRTPTPGVGRLVTTSIPGNGTAAGTSDTCSTCDASATATVLAW